MPRPTEHAPEHVERRYLLSLRSPRSRQRMRECIARLVTLTGGDWAALDRLSVLRAVRGLDGLGIGSQRLHVAALRGLMRAADVDPRVVAVARAPRGDVEPAGRALDTDEQAALVGACRSERDRAMVLTLLATGLRVSELVALDVADMLPGALTVRSGKGRKPRTVAIGPHVQAALLAHVGNRDGGPLFVTRVGERMAVRGVQLVLQTLAKRAGVGHVSPHDLRRSCATTAVAHGAQLDDVRVHLGHSSLVTTQRYLRADPVLQSRSVADVLARVVPSDA
jgi:integrase